ncbi:hypothetical protein F5146DRAFT_1136576 [Armillaria mellea]|nr:hypothetical protein F5146DRAFT_1136576 [Armillaria mellea]
MASPKQNITTPTIAELKKALKFLEDETDQKRKDIKTRLTQKKPVSMEDEEWLDEAGNLVDEVLEGFLASFGRKTHLEEAHSLKDTEITMYFTSN